MIIPNPLGRLTIRLYKDKKNDFSSSDNVFPRIIGIDQWTDVEQLSEDFVGESGMEYNFRKPGEYDTF